MVVACEAQYPHRKLNLNQISLSNGPNCFEMGWDILKSFTDQTVDQYAKAN